MDTFEWTLSARINAADSTIEAVQNTSKESGNADEPDSQTPVETTKIDSPKEIEATKESPLTTGYSYFCKTVEVAHQTTNFSPHDSCHYVTTPTDTVIVDLRYKFNPMTRVKCGNKYRCVLSRDLLDVVADQVREIVITALQTDNCDKEYRYEQYHIVYLLITNLQGLVAGHNALPIICTLRHSK